MHSPDISSHSFPGPFPNFSDTGAIGSATTIAFAKAGKYHLALHYNTGGEDVRKQLLNSSEKACSHSLYAIKAVFVQADLADFDSLRQIHASVQRRVGNVDILFHDAGTSGGVSSPSSLQQVSLDQFEAAWHVNVGAGILPTRSVSRTWKPRAGVASSSTPLSRFSLEALGGHITPLPKVHCTV